MMSTPPSSAAAPNGAVHFPALDGLRGIAILLVILHNSDVYVNASGLLWPAALLAHAGWIGVQLFFVLSGFLITGNLLDSQKADNYYQAFFARRALRILPLYYGVLLVALVVLPHVATLPPDVVHTHVHQLWLWTFLVNWTEPFGGGVHAFPHFWSLAVEEQFYLLWPFLIRRRSTPGVWKLCIALMLSALAIRCAMLALHARPEALYMFTISRMDALAAGAACAALVRMPRLRDLAWRRPAWSWLACLALGVVSAAVTDGYAVFGTATFTAGYTMLSVGFGFLVLAAVAPRPGFTAAYQSAMSIPILRSIGKYSYAMYVFHMPLQIVIGPRVLPALRQLTSFYPLLYTALLAVLSYFMALLSYHLYEKHFLKLKRRFVPDRAHTAALTNDKQRSPA